MLRSLRRAFSILFGTVFILSLSQSADVLTSYPCPKICGCYQGNMEEEIISVVCHLDVLKPDINFSVNTRISSILYLLCSSDGPHSQVSENMFISHTSFIGLRIENCKIPTMSGRFLYGLESLKHLEIKSTGTLEMEDSLFYHVPNITHITVTSSHVNKIPDLCRSTNLKYLNLSNNHLQSIDFSGLNCENDKVFSKLSTLILDKNAISKISKRNFRSTPYLTDLRIADGGLASIEDGTFSSLKSLTYLDITNNSITKVSPSMFHGNSDLQVLGLGRNRFSKVQNETFSSLQDLIVLTLDDAGLDNMVWVSLSPLRKLKDLQLQNNRITELSREVLFSLGYLQNLDLGNNGISDIIPEQSNFQNLNELRFLHLDGNKLQKIRNGTFIGLSNLAFLDLSGNRIQEIDTASFTDLKAITKLHLSKNLLTGIPNLKTLRTLQWLDLSANNLRTLSSSSFEGLHNLEHLNLSHNHITTIEKDVFSRIPKLKTLDLSFNQIEIIHTDAFDGMTHLSVLFMHHNSLKTISKIFLVLSSLKSIDLRFNKLMELKDGVFPDNIEQIDVAFNRISEISEYAIRNHQNLQRLSLKGNKLTKLARNALAIPRNQIKTTMVYLSDNPFNCDCNLIWLRKKMGDISMNSGLPMVGDIYSIQCFDGYEILTPKPLSDVKPENMLCASNTYCPNTCNCCELDTCDCLFSCPDECSCYNVSNTLYFTQCSNRGLNTIPVNIPPITIELFLDRNNISVINSSSFDSLFNLQAIHLGQCGIINLSNNSFKGLTNLKTLYLNNNNIQQITKGVFSKLWNLTELHLEYNDLSLIEEGAFSALTSLSILFLHHNNLITIPESTISLFWNLNNISLAGNPLSCNCNFISDHLPLLTNRSLIISDLNITGCEKARLQKQSNFVFNSTSGTCVEFMDLTHEANHEVTFGSWIIIFIMIAIFIPITIYGIVTISNTYFHRKPTVNRESNSVICYRKVNQKEEALRLSSV